MVVLVCEFMSWNKVNKDALGQQCVGVSVAGVQFLRVGPESNMDQ